jgi:hypothetical protein
MRPPGVAPFLAAESAEPLAADCTLLAKQRITIDAASARGASKRAARANNMADDIGFVI